MPLVYFFLIEVQLIYNIEMVSGAQLFTYILSYFFL